MSPLSRTTSPGELRGALRLLVRRPGLSAARLFTVTVVVAAVSAVFTVASATLLRPLPFPDPGRLVRVYFQPPGTTAFADADSLDALAFTRLRELTRTMEGFVGIFGSDRGVSGDGEPESFQAGRVTAGFFSQLGGHTVIGRTFTDAEFANADRVVVLSHGFWQRRVGGDPSVIGRTLTIDREAHTIVGVTVAAFEPGFTPSEFWTPLDLRKPSPYYSGVQTIGRLRPGITAAQAAGELNALLPRVAVEAPEAFKGWTMGVLDLREAQFGSRRATLLLLLAAVAGLGLIAVANLTNLTLADVMLRRGDFALRAALGGSRADLAGTEILQSLAIALAGAAGGLMAADWLVPALLALDGSSLPGRERFSIDWRVVLCGFGVSSAVMIAAVALPVWRIVRPSLARDLLAGAKRTTGGASARRVRYALVVVQTALGILLLSSGALVVRTFQAALRIDPGFEASHVVTAQLRLSEAALPTSEARIRFVETLLARLRETPGILAASTTLNPFVAGQGGAQSLAFVEDRPTVNGQPYRIQSRRVTPGYFATLGIPILHGRDFTLHDRTGTQPVAIVSRAFAERYWPGRSAIGRRAKRGVTTKEWAIVVGVVEDVRDVSVDQAPRDTLYTPFLQGAVGVLPVSLVVRTAGDPAGFIDAIKRVVWSLDPDQPLANIVTLDRFLHDSLGPQRFRAALVAAYTLLGLLLATIGTYGVTARSVIERTREAGVRLALGGSRTRVWWTLASASLRAVLAGAAAGAALSGFAAMALASAIPELGGGGWRTGGLAAAALALTGCAATLVAARAVLRIEPATALQP